MSVDTHDPEEQHGRRGERRDGQTRPLDKRHLPFTALAIVAFLVIPALETISWLINLWDPATGILIAWGWMVTGSLVAVVAMGIGLIVRRRTTFLITHVAVTAFVWGSASMLTTLAGWTKVWAVIHFFGSLITAMSWGLYRIDVFRAAATGSSADGWSSFIGLARSRPRKVTTSDTHVYVEVEHGPGETSSDVASAAKKLESAIGAIGGGTIVTPGERADTTQLAFEVADAFADWRNFPGLSHPGATFAAPFRTAYYATGVDQWFSFAATGDYRSPVTKFRSDADTFIGAAGLTGMGKSGFLNNAAAEGLSRIDCIVCWLDREKFLQNAGWCADMLGMGGNEGNGRDFTKALQRLAKYRVELFGQVALDAAVNPDDAAQDIGRKWTPELARETGEAAVLCIVDEADTAIHSDAWKWLAARARSLGIFLLPATPRVSTAEVPAVVRGSIGAWKTFGVGDNYSQGFTLSSATEDAGADPTKFREPGMHYLDRAPGIDPRMYPVKAREFKSHTKELRNMLLQARSTFRPAVFSAGAVEAMGDQYWQCHPRVVLKLETVESLKARHGQGEPPSEFVPDGAFDTETTVPMSQVEAVVRAVAAGLVAATPDEVVQAKRILAANGVSPEDSPPPGREGDDDEQQEEEEMTATADGTDLDTDKVATVDHRAAGTSDAELERELRGVDPRAPINVGHPGESVALDAVDPDKPRLSPEATEREFDRVIAAMAARGKMRFTNQEVMEEMRCEFSAVTCTRRLNGLADTERIVPPGLQVERSGRGNWNIVRSQPGPKARVSRER